MPKEEYLKIIMMALMILSIGNTIGYCITMDESKKLRYLGKTAFLMTIFIALLIARYIYFS